MTAARISGRDWMDSLAVHEFLDQSKIACADRRHRLMLHHVDLGADLTNLAFPSRTDVAELVRSHVREDLGAHVVLADWLGGVDRDLWPRPVARRLAEGQAGVCRMVGNRLHASQHPAVARVAALLFKPCDHYPDDPELALAILMHAAGPQLVRRLCGPPVAAEIDGQRVVTDWGWIAEAMIMTCYGRIPELGELVRAVAVEPIAARPAARRRVV